MKMDYRLVCCSMGRLPGRLLRPAFIAGLLAVVSLHGCIAETDDSAPLTPTVADATIEGGAAKGPFINSVAELLLFDFTAVDLKGELIATGSTDDTGAISGLIVPGDRIADGPFLIEFTGGTELDGSAPVIPTLRTLITVQQVELGTAIYATPHTTFALELARLSADLSNSATAAANFLAAVEAEPNLVKAYFGLGLLDNIDIFTVTPWLTTDGSQTGALNYRTAIEVLGALISELHAFDINTTPDEIFLSLAQDLSDGTLDAALDGASLDALSGIGAAQLLATLTKTPTQLSQLIVPGTTGTSMTPVAAINQLLADEAASIAPEVDPLPLAAPDLQRVVPGTDSDGDMFVDIDDEFPNDPTRVGDTDGDTVDDLDDAFPNDPAEWDDTDGDGVGDIADYFPNDPNRQALGDNTAAVASAGNDLIIEISTPVSLNGGGSTDADNDPISYSWQITASPMGSTPVLNNPLTAAPDFAADVAGDYDVELTVTDGFSGTDTDSVTIAVFAVVTNSPPTADAGADQQVEPGVTVDLNGSQSDDPNGDLLTYSWQFVLPLPAGSAAVLNRADEVAPDFVADVNGTFIVELTVDDGEFQSTDTVTIDVDKSFMTAITFLGSGLLMLGIIRIRKQYRKH